MTVSAYQHLKLSEKLAQISLEARSKRTIPGSSSVSNLDISNPSRSTKVSTLDSQERTIFPRWTCNDAEFASKQKKSSVLQEHRTSK